MTGPVRIVSPLSTSEFPASLSVSHARPEPSASVAGRRDRVDGHAAGPVPVAGGAADRVAEIGLGVVGEDAAQARGDDRAERSRRVRARAR